MKERQQKKREEKARAGGSDISNRPFFFFFKDSHGDLHTNYRAKTPSSRTHSASRP